jgi:hypothetical protein
MSAKGQRAETLEIIGLVSEHYAESSGDIWEDEFWKEIAGKGVVWLWWFCRPAYLILALEARIGVIDRIRFQISKRRRWTTLRKHMQWLSTTAAWDKYLQGAPKFGDCQKNSGKMVLNRPKEDLNQLQLSVLERPNKYYTNLSKVYSEMVALNEKTPNEETKKLLEFIKRYSYQT